MCVRSAIREVVCMGKGNVRSWVRKSCGGKVAARNYECRQELQLKELSSHKGFVLSRRFLDAVCIGLRLLK